MDNTVRIGVLGASGYTGADLIRLAAVHPAIEIASVTANTHAGKAMAEVFPHLSFVNLPRLTKVEDADWSKLDAVFCGLPHGTTQEIIGAILTENPAVKVVDMSADFRLRDPEVYRTWYGHEHRAPTLQDEAVYGLTEHYREEIRETRLVACPGCYPTASLLAILPIVASGEVVADDIVIDAKSGLSGAGRSPKQSMLLTEAGEGLSPYAVAEHRHAPEIEQEVSKVAGRPLLVNFTPHLVPMSRGELCSIYVRLEGGASAADLRKTLTEAYAGEPFVHVLAEGTLPQTQAVRGSNHVQIAVFADRIPGRAIVMSTLDNLVKGSAGQAIQNFNLMFGLTETTGLGQLPLFP